MASEPEALAAFLQGLSGNVEVVGLEAGPLSQWLHMHLTAAGFEVVLMETRHVKGALKAMPIKTDRRDAFGIARLLQMGWFRPVHCKSVSAQEMRAILTTRKAILNAAIKLEQSLRGVLRNFGLKMGQVSKARFEARVWELANGNPMLEAAVTPILRLRIELRDELAVLEKLLRDMARQDTACQLMMTMPGVGAIVALTVRSAIHDHRARVFDTLFGRFRLRAPRFRPCRCDTRTANSRSGPLSPVTHLFPDRATPELRRLQAELGSRHSFREAARVMETFLPCEKQINTTVRNRLGKIAHELSDREPIEIEADDDALTPPLTVFLDGDHIRCRPEYQRRHLDVVVGEVENPNMCRRFGLVKEAAASPAQQLRKDLSALGWDGKRPVTVISDGEPALPNLVRQTVRGQVRHILDWWHISMRVQHAENAIKGHLQTKNFPGISILFSQPARRLRW